MQSFSKQWLRKVAASLRQSQDDSSLLDASLELEEPPSCDFDGTLSPMALDDEAPSDELLPEFPFIGVFSMTAA